MKTRKLSDRYQGGPIVWTADADDVSAAIRGKTLRGGEVIDAGSSGPAVQFATIVVDGKEVHPVVRLEGRPRLAALAAEATRAADAKEKAEAAAARERDAALAALPSSAFHDDVERDVGETFLRKGEYLTVVGYQKRKVWDNFEDEWVWKHVAGCRPATETEKAKAIARSETRAKAKAAAAELKAVAKTIEEAGERPSGSNSPEGDTVRIGEGQTIYGGGSWFVVGPEWIWYVQNNGADGDIWDLNNVRTGGAGAIGWRVPATHDLAQQIHSLAATAHMRD